MTTDSGRTPPEALVERLRPHLLAAATGTSTGKAFSAHLFVDQLELLNSQVIPEGAGPVNLLLRGLALLLAVAAWVLARVSHRRRQGHAATRAALRAAP